MSVKKIHILPDLEIRLEMAAGVDAELAQAAEKLAALIAHAIYEDGTTVTGARLDLSEDARLRLAFYRQPGRTLREYVFERSDLMRAALAAQKLQESSTGAPDASPSREGLAKYLQDIQKSVEEDRTW